MYIITFQKTNKLILLHIILSLVCFIYSQRASASFQSDEDFLDDNHDLIETLFKDKKSHSLAEVVANIQEHNVLSVYIEFKTYDCDDEKYNNRIVNLFVDKNKFEKEMLKPIALPHTSCKFKGESASIIDVYGNYLRLQPNTPETSSYFPFVTFTSLTRPYFCDFTKTKLDKLLLVVIITKSMKSIVGNTPSLEGSSNDCEWFVRLKFLKIQSFFDKLVNAEKGSFYHFLQLPIIVLTPMFFCKFLNLTGLVVQNHILDSCHFYMMILLYETFGTKFSSQTSFLMTILYNKILSFI